MEACFVKVTACFVVDAVGASNVIKTGLPCFSRRYTKPKAAVTKRQSTQATTTTAMIEAGTFSVDVLGFGSTGAGFQ